MKVKVKRSRKGKAVKNQFVLNVGDEGAVFSHFAEGKLANKLFIDSPFSPDVKLIERLTAAYPKSPIYMLVDVIEQNYTQQVLPPVSSINIKQQIKRRIRRDFQPNDLNNVLPLGRSKEGRKDWNFLFISLANSDPFAKWLEIILSQKNDFGGVYLLPIEATKMIADLNKSFLKEDKTDWELLVLHNKTGGFRIVAFKGGRILFTRLAQNLVGENIAEITVGNMEQEISNTVEYLKRLTFKGEAESRITIVAGADILQKVTPKSLKFGKVELMTPYQLSEKLGLPEAVSEKDKYADIMMATHFAAAKKHVLKFSSAFTKKIESIYIAIRSVYVVAALISVALLGYAGFEAYQTTIKSEELDSEKVRKNQAEGRLKEVSAKVEGLPKNVSKLVEVMKISNMLPLDEYQTIRVISDIGPVFDEKFTLEGITFNNQSKAKDLEFSAEMDVTIYILARDQDKINEISAQHLNNIASRLKDHKVEYVSAPTIQNTSTFEDIKDSSTTVNEVMSVPARIKISKGGV